MKKKLLTYIAFQQAFNNDLRCNFQHFDKTVLGFPKAIILADVAKSVK